MLHNTIVKRAALLKLPLTQHQHHWSDEGAKIEGRQNSEHLQGAQVTDSMQIRI